MQQLGAPVHSATHGFCLRLICRAPSFHQTAGYIIHLWTEEGGHMRVGLT
jgi:hypothetical protein